MNSRWFFVITNSLSKSKHTLKKLDQKYLEALSLTLSYFTHTDPFTVPFNESGTTTEATVKVAEKLGWFSKIQKLIIKLQDCSTIWRAFLCNCYLFFAYV